MAQTRLEDLATATAGLLSGDFPLGWQFDPALVRGTGYYTGQIFEISQIDLHAAESAAGASRPDSQRRCPRYGRLQRIL